MKPSWKARSGQHHQELRKQIEKSNSASNGNRTRKSIDESSKKVSKELFWHDGREKGSHLYVPRRVRDRALELGILHDITPRDPPSTGYLHRVLFFVQCAQLTIQIVSREKMFSLRTENTACSFSRLFLLVSQIILRPYLLSLYTANNARDSCSRSLRWDAYRMLSVCTALLCCNEWSLALQLYDKNLSSNLLLRQL